MNVESFLSHHGITENPFGAEEARHDPVYTRLIEENASHPDFDKILGQIDKPRTSVVFGEKGSGKTAIRMSIEQRVVQHNQQHADHRTLVVAYDDLNPVLDRVMQRRRGEMGFGLTAKTSLDKLLGSFRLEDHQDAILSLAVTRLVDAILGSNDGSGQTTPMPAALRKVIKKMPRQLRVNMAVLAALYDQPRTGAVAQRWRALRARMRLGWVLPARAPQLLGTVLAMAVAGLMVARVMMANEPVWLVPAAGLAGAGAVVMWGLWARYHLKLWRLARRIHQELLAVGRKTGDLRAMLLEMRRRDVANQPWPVPARIPGGRGLPGNQDSRYQLTDRLLGVLAALGYEGIMVLVDRVDEPTLICGHDQRMRSVVWPMLDNKFLQQDGVGIKLLLPIELRHLLHRESTDFFQEARLDKQNLIDRLTWSGTMLYDLCTARLRACRREDPAGIHLTDLFDADVSREMIIDALDQMHQPRDAFKFLYCVLQEHCRMLTEDQAIYKIARLTLEAVRRQQSQRVQELYKGLTPA